MPSQTTSSLEVAALSLRVTLASLSGSEVTVPLLRTLWGFTSVQHQGKHPGAKESYRGVCCLRKASFFSSCRRWGLQKQR